jgi:hypothetical protein
MGHTFKDGIMPFNYKEPSTVLYQLLGMLLEASKEFTSSTDAMQGAQNATNVPATSMLAMIEQGMKMFSAIQRRLYRSLKEEYQKIYKLNAKHLDEEDYITVLGPLYRQVPNIYKTKLIKVVPVADPNLSSDAQRLAQAQVIMGVANQPGSLISQYEAQKRMLQAAKVNNIDELLPPEAKNQPKQPDPKMIDIQAKHQTKMAEVQIKARKQDLQEKEWVAKLSKLEAEITQMQANALKLVSQAKSEDVKSHVSQFDSQLEALKTKISAVSQAHQQLTQASQQQQALKLQQQQITNQHQQEMQSQLIQHHKNVNELDQGQQEIDNARQDNSSNGGGMDETPSDGTPNQ